MEGATIDRLAWLQGHWKGPAFDGVGEEIWSPPSAHSIMGVYRLVQDGVVVFFEMLAVAEEGSSLVLRLRHFSPDLKGWEEKDKPQSFPLTELTAKAVSFGSGLTYRLSDPNTLHITIKMKQKDGSIQTEEHKYYRVRPG